MNSSVYHFSIRNQLCPVEQCPRKLDDGTPIYQDVSHLFSGGGPAAWPRAKASASPKRIEALETLIVGPLLIGLGNSCAANDPGGGAERFSAGLRIQPPLAWRGEQQWASDRLAGDFRSRIIVVRCFCHRWSSVPRQFLGDSGNGCETISRINGRDQSQVWKLPSPVP